jgi:imidazole glycerol-phosphate synthase subunit HisF
MVMKRVIPCLDVASGRVVKGVQFKGLRDAGDPVTLASRYAEEGADELVFLDVTAGVEGRDTATRVVRAVARQVFVPLTVGGGVRSAADAARLLDSGADKVAVNSAAVRRPELLAEIAARFGRQCVVLAVDALATPGGYRVAVDAGRTVTDVPVADWITSGMALGAGEVLLTSVERDGSHQGYDLELLGEIAPLCAVPLIASGGLATGADAAAALAAGADAVLAASRFHDGELSIAELKGYLAGRGFEVRPC